MPRRHHRTTLIALTVNEFRRLFDALLLRPLHAVADVPAWSNWRRKQTLLTVLNRPGMSEDSVAWERWGHVSEFVEQASAGAA
jgi:hypothetical protein